MSDPKDAETSIRRRTERRAADVAAEYRDQGWDALALQPANLVPIPVGPDTGESRPADADVGLSFLLPEAEFDLLAELSAAGPEREVYRADVDSHVAAVVVLRDDDLGHALVLPVVFREPTAGAMAREARERGQLELIARPADTDR
ncbi:MAG: hypothetical protein ABEJ74_02865, partial [Haloferacaceae archaeon]